MSSRSPYPPDNPGLPGTLRAGAVVAGYRLEERIGTGGMAVVFRAYDSRLDRQVALKVLAPALAADDAFRRRFIRESRAAAAVDDPHIIPVYEAGEAAGVLFIAMRYVRGGDVRSLIDRVGPLPPDRVASLVSQIASALDAANSRGLVHRDVKPANMLLESRHAADLPDHVYLSDFGLTKTSVGTSQALTASGDFLGTVDYVSPEQIEGRTLDGRCDQYALACSAFEMLSGRPPFRRDQGISVVYAHLSEPPPPLRSLRPELPEATEAIMMRALAKAASDRYRSSGEFATALRQALTAPAARADPARAGGPDTQPALPVAAASGPPPTQMLPPPRRRRPWWRSPALIGGICVPVVVLAVGGAVLASRTDGTAGAGGSAALSPPGCTRAVGSAKQLAGVTSQAVRLPGPPFGVVARGQYSFVSGNNTLAVLRDSGAGQAPALVRTISVPGATTGDAITGDGGYVLAAVGSGAAVIDVAEALDGAPDPVVGSLTSPSGSGAVQVALSPDDRYAFVTLQNSAELAVFNLQAALTRGFGRPSDFIGYVHVGNGPNGVAAAGDSLYVANEGGKLTVISLSRAETDPAHAVNAMVAAGCGPARVAVSAGGTVLWVTAADSDALLGFSTAKLRTDPAHALVADVRVGEEPLGVTLVADGSRLVVADSDEDNARGLSPNLAVVDTARALTRKPALLGYLPTGMLPRQLAVASDGRTLLVTLTNSGELQTVDIPDLAGTGLAADGPGNPGHVLASGG